MKSIAIFLLLAFLVALITVPEHEQFNKYLAKKGKNVGTCLGGTTHRSYKVYTLDYVDYCTLDLKKTRSDKYIGLFGTFWKL